MLEVSHYIGLDGLQSLELTWRSILEEITTQHLFHQFDWYQSYIRALPSNEDIYFFLIKEKDIPIAIWPLVYNRNKNSNRYNKIWQSPNFSEILGFDVICRPASNFNSSLAELRKHINMLNNKPWHFIDLHLTLSDSSIVNHLPIKHSLKYSIYDSNQYSYIDCTQEYALYLELLNKKYIRNLQRRLRNLKKEGEVEFKTFVVNESLQQQLDAFLAIEVESWKGLEGTAIEQNPVCKEFYTQFVKHLSKNDQVFFNTLSLNQQIIASQICVRIDNRVFGYKMTFNDMFNKYSPGHLLLFKLIDDCFVANSIDELDFMTYANWHSDFATATGGLYHVILYNNNIYGVISSVLQNIKMFIRKIKRRII